MPPRHRATALFALVFVGALPGAPLPADGWGRRIPWREAGLTERQAAAHLLDRFAHGPRPGEIDAVVEQGLGNWLEGQLAGDLPGSLLASKLARLPALTLAPREIVLRYSYSKLHIAQQAIAAGVISREDYAGERGERNLKNALARLDRFAAERGLHPEKELLAQLRSQKLLRAVYAHSQLVEVLTDFWFNHFNVSATRRVFLRSGGLALLSLGAGARFLDRLALAMPASARPTVLVSIFLRGAMDGLMAVPPLAGDGALERFRPRLAMSAARSAADPVLDLGAGFGLHPALAPLLPRWREGRLAIVHAVGSPNPTRSHFAAQDYMETGTPWRRGTPSGWLNRVAGRVAGAASPFKTVSITPDLPRSLYGDESALAIADLADFRLYLNPAHAPDKTSAEHLEVLYERGAGGSLRQRGGEMFEAMRRLSKPEIDAYRLRHGRDYPPTALGRNLLQIAYLIKSGAGLRIACTESTGWDTHVRQGTAAGAFARQAADLAQSIAAFWNDVEPYHDDVVVLTMTEFGRTVRENGSGGTDHGHGSCLFALGNRVDGGQVYGDFPALVPEALFEGRDLPVTTDFRAVFSEVAGKLFDLDDDGAIFPGWAGARLPLLW